jgi:hypothetical protein
MRLVMNERKRAKLMLNEAKNVGDAVHRRGFLTKCRMSFAVCSRLMTSRISLRHIIFAALLNSAQAWLVQSQPELERRFVDILCTRLPSIPVNWSFAFELKYLKKKDAAQLPAKAEEAKTQLEGYLQTEDLQRVDRLAAYAIVFVGAEAKSVVRVR